MDFDLKILNEKLSRHKEMSENIFWDEVSRFYSFEWDFERWNIFRPELNELRKKCGLPEISQVGFKKLNFEDLIKRI